MPKLAVPVSVTTTSPDFRKSSHNGHFVFLSQHSSKSRDYALTNSSCDIMASVSFDA